MSLASDSPSRVWLPDYRTVWRWHFYAGLFTLPFVIILSVTGSIYLFKPQIEAWNDRHYDRLQFTSAAPISEQVTAALAHFPGSTPQSYEVPRTEDAAGRVLVRMNGETIRVYVHPETLEVLHSVVENQRFMRSMFRLHGELWLGDRGSNLVELASSWTILMIVTGLYLWWPRNRHGLGGVLYPRWWKGSRLVWRDLHSVTGVWISFLALFLLVSGLPWAKFWGNYFKTIRSLTGTAVAQQDWSTGSERSSTNAFGRGSGSDHQEHGGGGRRSRGFKTSSGTAAPIDLRGFDRIAASVAPLQLDFPVVIAPPARGSEHWTAKSMTPNRPRRVNLVLDGKTGEIISRENFQDRHWVDRVVGIGIAAHEGQLFGWPNQLLGLFTAAGLALISVSGAIMWWKRREPGRLGTPAVAHHARLSPAVMLLILGFAIYLPLFGASLLLMLVIEKLILCRIPALRDWLGLRRDSVVTHPAIAPETGLTETQAETPSQH